MNLCSGCGAELVRREATGDSPYHYKLSGLSHVYLIGIEIGICGSCGAEYPRIPRVGELHRVIADCLIEKTSPLVGEEIRYLRKYAGVPANKLALALGQTPSHLSRVENGKHGSLGAAADRLVRLLAMDRKKKGTLIEQFLALAKQIGSAKKTRPACPTFEQHRGHWMKKAA